MSLAKLSIDLEARLAGLQEGMDKAALLAQRNADRIEASFSGIRQSAAAVGTVLAGAFAGFSLGSVVKTAIDAADHLNDLSKATGIAVETLGGIGFAASQAGTDLDGVAASLGKLNLAIAKAGSGDRDMAATFSALGIAIRDAEGRARSADAVFADVATKFAGYADGPNKAALANQLFGKSYSSVLPLLADGGAALRDNIAYYERFAGVTADTARAADEFNDTLGKLNLIAGSFGRKLAAELLPTLKAIADELLKSKEAGGQFAIAGELLAEAFKATTVFGANVLFVLTSIGRELGAIGAQAAAAVRGDWAGFNAISQAVKEDGERARAELERFERRVLQSAQVGLNTGSGPRGAVAALADAPAPGGGSTGGSSAGRDRAAVRGLLADRQEAFRAAELAIQQSVEEALRTGQLRDIESERADALAAIAERQARLNALIAATPTAKLEEERQAMLLLADAFERGAITAEQFSEAASTRLGNIAPESKAQLEEMSTFANQAARNIQDALGNTLEATLNGNFENIGQMWKSLLIRMAAEAAAAQIGKELFGNFGSGSNSAGGGGGLIGDLIKLLPVLFSAKGHGFAGGAQAFGAGGILGPYGGMLTRPTVFPMANGGIGIGGEAGTEAVMPLKRGRDGKLGVAAQTGGGIVVNLQVVNHIDSRSDAAAVSLLVADGVRQGQRQMLDYLRARGVAA